MKVLASAKINITLEVFGKRTDGYHALRSVVMPISLADTIEIERTNDGSLMSDTGYDDDLCLKAARILKCHVASLASSLGARIHVTKRIPAGGGLGGGSADAAAVLRVLNKEWGLYLTVDELAELASQVGSDVPALIYGEPVVMEGRGEKVTPFSEIGLKPSTLYLVLVNPNVHSSTKDVYAACTPRMAGGATSATKTMLEALRTGELNQIAAAMQNDLQEPAERLHPEIASARAALAEAGATGVLMSGSGACVFGLVANAAESDRLAAFLASQGFAAQAITTIPSHLTML